MASLTNAVQQNLLVLLAYDEKVCTIIRGVIDPALFEGDYREVVSTIYKYIDKYKRPPRENLADLFDTILEDKKNKKRKIFKDLLSDIIQYKDSINVQYTMDRLTSFVREQKLKISIIEAYEVMQSDEENGTDRAIEILAENNKFALDLFDPGIFLNDTKQSLDFLKPDEGDVFLTGIKEFDRVGIGPARKELFLIIAPAKRGKTWALCSLAKFAVLHRKKVCHISLEMSAKKMAQRYYQMMFNMSKRKEKTNYIEFETNSLDNLIDVKIEERWPELSMDDPKILRKLTKKIGSFSGRLGNLVVKEFPTGALTMQMLRAYLDNLEAQENFIPDLLILDYPDLMELNINNYRLDLGKVYKDLRGLGVERNMAMAIATQSNRGGAKSSQVTDTDVAEDYSKIATVDTVITYTQTPQEKELGCARLFVANGRNDVDRFTVLITQNYNTGQFVLDSTPLYTQRTMSSYFDIVKDHVGDIDEEDEDY